MNATNSINSKFIRMFANILSIVVILAMAFPVTSIVSAAPVATDSKQLVGNRIGLYGGPTEYPLNTPFHIRHGWLLSSQDDAVGIFDFVLEVDGILRKEDFKDIWTENGEPDILQRRWVFNFPDGMTGRHTFTGHWFAPCQYAVDKLGYSGTCLTPNAKVETENKTLTVNFTPTFVAYLPVTIVGYSWPLGHTIDISINGDEYTAHATVGNADWDPMVVLFELWRDDFTMEAGDHIVMTDETVGITKETWVTNLAITDFDLGAGTVSGNYDSDYSLWVWLYDRDGQIPATAPDGTWVATFTELPPNAWGGATQWDADGDGTSVDFQVPNPNFYALPDENKIFAQEWIAGFDLELKIYDSNGNEIHSESRIVMSPSEVPWTLVVFDLNVSGFDLLPGQRIVLNQRGYERELIVSSLMITEFDLANKQIKGTGDAGAQIFIRINGEDVWGTVDGDGNWVISHPQLTPSVWGEAIQPDGVDGDETRDGFQAPNPNFYAVPDENKIFAQEWIAGFDLELKIYDANGNEIHSESQTVMPPSEVPWTLVVFDLNVSGFDLLPGQRIVLNQRGHERELIVHNLQVTDFNLNYPITISGIADPGRIFISVNGVDMSIEVGDEGIWQASSTEYESGEWGSVIITDDGGDQTRDIFMIPYP